jgi:hypothetical protein
MIKLRAVLDQLVAEGLAKSDSLESIAPALAVDETTSNPWYVRALVGISAWIAAALLIAFLLGGTSILSSAPAAIATGLVLCAIATAIRRFASEAVFGVQLALALGIAGQALLGAGVAGQSESLPITVLAVVMLEAALIAIYPDSVQRFLAPIVIAAALVALLLHWELPAAIHLLVTLLAAGAAALWLHESALASARAEPIGRPIGYGAIVALLGILCLGITESIPIPRWWLSSIGLLLVLLAIEYHILFRATLRPDAVVARWLAIGTVLVSVPALWMPGILAATIVLALGFQRGNRILLGLAAIFLVIFLIAFYYNLEVTLLAKSLLLLVAGLLLLGLRALLAREFRS